MKHISPLIFALLSIVVSLSLAHAGILASNLQLNDMMSNALAEKATSGTALEGKMWLLLTYIDSQGKETKVLPGSRLPLSLRSIDLLAMLDATIILDLIKRMEVSLM